jgi:hypothetical protein
MEGRETVTFSPRTSGMARRTPAVFLRPRGTPVPTSPSDTAHRCLASRRGPTGRRPATAARRGRPRCSTVAAVGVGAASAGAFALVLAHVVVAESLAGTRRVGTASPRAESTHQPATAVARTVAPHSAHSKSLSRGTPGTPPHARRRSVDDPTRLRGRLLCRPVHLPLVEP